MPHSAVTRPAANKNYPASLAEWDSVSDWIAAISKVNWQLSVSRLSMHEGSSLSERLTHRRERIVELYRCTTCEHERYPEATGSHVHRPSGKMRATLATGATRMPEPSQRSKAPRPARATKSSRRQPLGRLRSYSVTDLFGNAEYSYSFDLDPKEPTLLTGVNGTGKSTILRSIDAISTSNWAQLLELPFTSLTLRFDSSREISVKRASSATTISLTGEEPWKLDYSHRIRSEAASTSRQLELRALRRDLERELEYIDARIGTLADTERDEYDIERLRLREQRILLRERLRTLGSHIGNAPEWTAYLSSIFPVLFITDQRLIVETDRGSGRVSTRADEAARQIAQEISRAKALYANRSQALDRDFPQRVVKAIANPPNISDEELRRRLDEITQTRESLESVGLLPVESASEFEGMDLAPAHVRAVINTYVEDTQKKLEALEPLRIKLRLFSDFLSQHYKRKRIKIDPEHGFTISVTNGKDALAPGKLSSGEQQIMVLAHQILFRATPGTLVLIDEPELSLHVLWQASFVQDLTEMGKVNNLSYLLATHSPTLIGGREDLKRSLDLIAGA